MTTQTSDQKPRAPAAPRLTQPEAMKTRTYVYGVEKLNGFDAWALFEACALGDVPKAKAFTDFVHHAFATRRKKLANNLLSMFGSLGRAGELPRELGVHSPR